MSDRCEVRIQFPTKVNSVVKQVIGCWDDLTNVNGVSYGVIHRASYCFMDKFRALAKELVPFTALHSESSLCGPEVIASYAGILAICESNRNGRPVAAVYEDGRMNEEELQNIENYYALKRMVIKEWTC